MYSIEQMEAALKVQKTFSKDFSKEHEVVLYMAQQYLADKTKGKSGASAVQLWRGISDGKQCIINQLERRIRELESQQSSKRGQRRRIASIIFALLLACPLPGVAYAEPMQVGTPLTVTVSATVENSAFIDMVEPYGPIDPNNPDGLQLVPVVGGSLENADYTITETPDGILVTY